MSEEKQLHHVATEHEIEMQEWKAKIFLYRAIFIATVIVGVFLCLSALWLGNSL